MGARFGDVVEFEGLWTTRGQALHVVLLWRALADHPNVSAKVFVHLMDAEGQWLAQDDGIPVAWTRPLGTWQLGEQIMDVHSLRPPDGRWLRVGLYDPDTLIRLPAYDAGGARLPDDYTLVPLGS